jgi:hypothetical protein
MNKKLMLWASTLALLVSAAVASAAGLPDVTVNKLMDLYGVSKQIATIPEAIITGFAEAEQEAGSSGNKSPLSDQDFKELNAAISGAFKADPLLQATAASIKKKVSEQDAKQVLAWLESDLGKKITQAEVDATNDQVHGNIMNDARTLMADKERVNLAHKLDQLLHATDDAVDFQVQLGTMLYVVMSRRLHPDQALDEAAIKKEVLSSISRSSIEQSVILDFVYTYRKIDLHSLEKYIAFLDQPAARRFNDSIREGLMDGMNKCKDKAAESIAAMAKKKNPA